MYINEMIQGFVIKIDCSKFKSGNTKFSWRRGKKFMYNSLIIFSLDGFETYNFGIVREADKKTMDADMKKYGHCYIYIEIVNTQRNLFKNYNRYQQDYIVIIESRCFFEAVEHTLKTLKEIKRVPFQNIILGHDNRNNRPPSFMKKNIIEKVLK